MNKKDTTSKLLEFLGWIGVVFILFSYCLLAVGFIDGQSLAYHGLILFGSTFVALISYKKRTYQPMVMNIVFAALAVFAIIRIIVFPL